LERIWPNPISLLKIWCIKNAEDPQFARNVTTNKDTFERQDMYDGQGVGVWIYLHIKQQIDQVCQSTNSPAYLLQAANLIQYHKFSFLFEACIPTINFLI
jgi:hypothetical protein